MKDIVITAGHSNTDPGAVNGVVTEAHIVSDFRNMVSFYLTRAGVAHKVDGEGAENKPLSKAIALITPGAVAIEFHCNAASSPSATGVETLSKAQHFALGESLCRTIASVLEIRNRGAKGEGAGQHSRLGFVQAGGVICELFFISNNDDLKRYLDKKWLVARAVAFAIMDEAKK